MEKGIDSETKITIIGIGGIGSYIAALLCRTYQHVSLIARGDRRRELSKNGLVIHSDISGRFTAYPETLTDTPELLPIQDYVFICVKRHSLESACESIRPLVGKSTTVIPVLNGIDHGEYVRNYLKIGTTLEALIYIVSYLSDEGVVTQEGNYAHLHIGLSSPSNEEMIKIKQTYSLLELAGLPCIIEHKPYNALWKKFIFNCAFNMLTAYYCTDVAGLRKFDSRCNEFLELMREAAVIALKNGAFISKGYIDRQYHFFLKDLKPDASSSLSRDIADRKKNELQIYGGYLIEQARKFNINLPLTKEIYDNLSKY